MSILAFIVFGFIVGLIARAIMPGKQSMGILPTTLLGVVGSLVGGFVANLAFGYRVLEIHTAGFIGSIIGAVVCLALLGFIHKNRHV